MGENLFTHKTSEAVSTKSTVKEPSGSSQLIEVEKVERVKRVENVEALRR